MVVIASVQYAAGETPAVVRVRNALGASFDVMVQNPCHNSLLSDVVVNYIVIEAGVYSEASAGVTAEAVRIDSTVTDHAGSWVGSAVAVANTYTAPVVLGQVMSTNDSDWSQFWCYDGVSPSSPPSSSGVAIGKHVGQDSDTARMTETIGYLVIESGSGVLGGMDYVAAVGPDIIQGPDNGPSGQYSFSPAFSSLTSVVANQVAMDAADGGWAVVTSASNSAIDLVIEEDQCFDGERSHTTEQVGYLAFGQRAVPVGPNPRTGSVVCNYGEWATVTLDHTYQSMVVIASAQDAVGDTPVVVRVQNAEDNSFAVTVQSACGAAPSSGITVDYLAIEEGVFTVAANGVQAEAFKTTSSVTDHAGSWVGAGRPYSNSYDSPVVLGQVMSYNNAGWSEFWSYDGATVTNPPSSTGLAIGKHVGEDANTSRSDEILGCVVIESGTGTIDGMSYAAGVGPDTILGRDDGAPGQYSLADQFRSISSVLVSQAGMDGAEGGWAVPISRSNTTIDLVIEEDRCFDLERSHTSEQVGYLVFGEPSFVIFSDGFETGDTSRWF